MPCYATTVVTLALNEEGYLEKKSNKNLDDKTANAGSANYTKYGRDMHKLEPSVMDFPAAWCDAFVDDCFVKAYGVEKAKELLCGAFNDYTPSSAQLYKNAGRWGDEAKFGAQIFFKNSTRICHTGLVYAVDSKYVYTIEGNTSGASGVISNGGGVCKKKYLRTNSRIAGYGYPKYDGNYPPKFEGGHGDDFDTNPVGPIIKRPEDVIMKQIQKNSTGKAVRVWQSILGFTGDDIDGKFGNQTKEATIAFQKKAFPGQEDDWDGVVGPKTWKAGLESVR